MGRRRSTVQLAMCHTKTRFVVCGILLFASRAFALPVDEAERVQRTNGTMAAVDPVIAVLTQTQQDEDANTGDSNELEVGGRGTCKKWCKFENHCKWNACTGCTLCRTPAPTPKTLSFGEAKPMNTKLFGIGDDWTKLKGGGRLDFKQLKDAVSALGLGQTRFPGGANSNYWDIELAKTPTLPPSPTEACPAAGWSGFSKADEGKAIKIAKNKVAVNGVTRTVPWGMQAKVKDAKGKILSVDEKAGCKVTLDDGSQFENPGAAPPCTCETAVCPKKGFSMCMLEMQTNEAPKDHLKLSNFLKSIVFNTDAQMPILVLNVLTMPMERTKQIVQWLGKNLASLRAEAGTARAKSEPILIEIGNEFYLDAMYDCFLGKTASKYAELLHDLVPFIRAHLPADTRIGVVGYQEIFLEPRPKSGIHHWNEQLNASGILPSIDAITLHDYNLNPNVARKKGNDKIFGRELNEGERASAQAAWGAASAEATQRHFVNGVFAGKTAWVTEYGVLQKHYLTTPFLASTRLSGVAGLFMLGRILAGVRYSNVFESLEWFNLGFANFGMSMMINMEEVLKDPEHGQVKVNGNAQMFAHVSSLAMKATAMHGISIVEGPDLPFRFHEFGEQQAAKCIQAGAFVNAEVASVIMINRCQSEIDVTFDIASGISRCGAGRQCQASAWLYPTAPGVGEWTPLPESADVFPWPGPLHPHKVPLPLAAGVTSVAVPPLGLAIATFSEA